MTKQSYLGERPKIHEVLEFISLIRESNKDACYLYKNGQCYNFAKILRYIFPNHEFYYDYINGHVYSKINGFFYDIDGLYKGPISNFEKLDHKRRHKPHRWHKREGKNVL